jgi:predicted phage terminase large subunit-like protein
MPSSVDALIAVLRSDFLSFTRKAFETIEGKQLSDDRYILVVLYHLLRLHRSEAQRLIINLPLRHGKTLLAAIFTTWTLAHDPTLKILVLSQLEDLATVFVQHMRTIVEATWFKRAFTLRLKKGHDRSGYFRTDAEGAVFARSLNSKLAGFGADLIVIDDPADPRDASNLPRLLEINEYVESLVLPRLNNPASGRILVIQHRLHALDLTGHLLSRGGWEHLKLPLVAEKSESHPFDGGIWHRQKDEPLRPSEYSAEYIERLKESAGVPDFSTFYQQEPPENLLSINADDFQTFDTVPTDAGGVVLSVDPAAVDSDRSSFSVIQAWRARESSQYLLDLWRGKVRLTQLEREIKRFIKRHQPAVLLIETAGVGVAIAERFHNRKGLTVEHAEPSGQSKIERLLRVIAFFRSKSIFLPKGALWSAAFVEEMTTFPNSEFDDQVDACSQYLLFTMRNPVVLPKPKRSMGSLGKRDGALSAEEISRSPTHSTPNLIFTRRHNK